MKKSGSQRGESPSQLIDTRIKELGDWRGEMLGRLRNLVKEADRSASLTKLRSRPEHLAPPVA